LELILILYEFSLRNASFFNQM